MFAKSTVLFALFAAAVQVAVAAPPACLLAAVNTQQSPADLPTLCGSDSSKVQAAIKKVCGGDTQSALDAYAATCKNAGKTVSISSSSGSSTSSSSVSASVSGSGSGSASATGAPYPVVYTSTYYDTVCSCTKTAVSSTVVAGSTGFATGTAAPTGSSPPGSGAGSASSPAATGSPIIPSATKGPGGPTNPPKFTGAATKNIGSFAAVILAIAGLTVAWISPEVSI